MPYKNREEQKAYQRKWVAERRAAYLKGKSCVNCGATEHLQIDHINPKKKWKHTFWSYSWAKIFKELKKCQILCYTCHMEKSIKERGHDTLQKHEVTGCKSACCDPEVDTEPLDKWKEEREGKHLNRSKERTIKTLVFA